jgi:predicted extracellular nuclease
VQPIRASFELCNQFVKKTAIFILLLGAVTPVLSQELVITGVVDAGLTGGTPKAIEIYVTANVVDLSIFGLGSANNGGGTDGEEFTFPPVSATAGDYIYVASESPQFTVFFGFSPDYTSGAASINGDDAIELFKNGSVVDVFGDINVDGTGEPWEHLDGWAYRNDNTGPDGSVFALGNWTFSGPNALDGETTNDTAAKPFPVGTYIRVGGDVPPIVQSTSPTNGAVAVALDASITINFSEDVTVSGTWFDISCDSSAGHNAVVSGGLQSYTLAPDTDFDNSENCVVTIFAAQVADQDDSPDNMAANHVFSFDTAALALSTPLVINEIDYDQSGTDSSEFIELFNASGSPINLSLYSVELVNGNGDTVYDTIALPDLDLAAGDFFVICANAATVPNCDLDDSPNTNFIQNGDPDAVALLNDGVVADTVSYEGDTAAPYTEGSGAGLKDSAAAFTGISRLPDGNDTDQNNADFSLRCITPGKTNSSDNSGCVDPTPPALKINEIDYDQPGGDSAEFVELINAGPADIDLTGIELLLVNGNGATVYQTIALPAITLDAGGFYVICEDAATVPNCDLDIISSIQNGSPDAVALVRGGQVLDTVSYEGDTAVPYTETSGAGLVDSGSGGQDNRGISRFPNGVDTDQNNIDLANACITPGTANTSVADNCGPIGPILEIHEIQGSGASSPVAGSFVSTLGNVVTAINTDGFFMQAPDARADADPLTSEGIFVFTGGLSPVVEGDRVDVAGTVAEFFDFTEIANVTSVTVIGTDPSLPSTVALDASMPGPSPSPQEDQLERIESMLVIFEGIATGPSNRFGNVPVVTQATRSFREAGVEFPGLMLPPIPTWDGNPEVFELNPDGLGGPDASVFANQEVAAEGVLTFSFGNYQVLPKTMSLGPEPVLPTSVRPRNAAEMTVGSLNMFRFFDDATVETRRTKFAGYILDVMDAPDILAVQEVGSIELLQDLAAEISTVDPSVNYTAFLVEGNDVGGINVGFMVRDNIQVDAVTQLGKDVTYIDPGDDSLDLLNDRPPLLLEGRCTADGSDFPIAVMVIHSRSLNRVDEDPGQGPRVREKRLGQAQFVAQEVQDLQTVDPDINLVVIGDFNAFEFTDGYVDVTGQMKGDFVAAENLLSGPDLVDPNLVDQALVIPAQERYSFVFGGNAQVLDHALTSSGLDELIRDFVYSRGNADVPGDLIEDVSTVLRSSDHDGIVLFLAKDSDGDGVTDDLDRCMGTVIPETAPQRYLQTNNFVLADDDRLFDTTPPNGTGPEASFDIFDTAGCSCEQIIDELGLGKGHTKFGCSLGAMEEWVEFID